MWGVVIGICVVVGIGLFCYWNRYIIGNWWWVIRNQGYDIYPYDFSEFSIDMLFAQFKGYYEDNIDRFFPINIVLDEKRREVDRLREHLSDETYEAQLRYLENEREAYSSMYTIYMYLLAQRGRNWKIYNDILEEMFEDCEGVDFAHIKYFNITWEFDITKYSIKVDYSRTPYKVYDIYNLEAFLHSIDTQVAQDILKYRMFMSD